MKDDYISRQAAIDAICDEWCYATYDNCPHRDEEDYTCDGCDDIKRLESIPSADRPTGWIPCSVKLPKRGIDVLVTRDYDGRKDYQRSRKYVETAVCYGEDEDADWVSFSDEYKTTPESHRVTAWMPLPEPWKGGEHDVKVEGIKDGKNYRNPDL